MLRKIRVFMPWFGIRYFIIIFLITSIFFLFHRTSSFIYFHPFAVPSIATPNNSVVIRHLYIGEKSYEQQSSFINNTNNLSISHSVRSAVVSALYNDDYVEGVEVLGYSLQRINIRADLILFSIGNRLNQSTLNRCRRAGWYLHFVARIDPPRFAIIYQRFRDQFTKLRIWSMIEYERVLYLDADTLVVDDINSLLTGTIFENYDDGLLAAVEDVWQGTIGPNFNAGVLLIRPNMTIFNEMLIKMHNMPAYGSYWAEQGFLNWYFKGSTGRLPLIYNFNNALAIYHRDIYMKLRDHARIIHYTYYKPFPTTKQNRLSDKGLIELWTTWRKMYDNMYNQSFIS